VPAPCGHFLQVSCSQKGRNSSISSPFLLLFNLFSDLSQPQELDVPGLPPPVMASAQEGAPGAADAAFLETQKANVRKRLGKERRTRCASFVSRILKSAQWHGSV